jgi:hypothetical protein
MSTNSLNAMAVTIAVHSGPPGTQGGMNIVERIRKHQLSTAKQSSGSEILRIASKDMHLRPRVVYVDQHKRETLTVAPEGNRPVTIGSKRRSHSSLIN